MSRRFLEIYFLAKTRDMQVWKVLEAWYLKERKYSRPRKRMYKDLKAAKV